MFENLDIVTSKQKLTLDFPDTRANKFLLILKKKEKQREREKKEERRCPQIYKIIRTHLFIPIIYYNSTTQERIPLYLSSPSSHAVVPEFPLRHCKCFCSLGVVTLDLYVHRPHKGLSGIAQALCLGDKPTPLTTYKVDMMGHKPTDATTFRLDSC